MKKFLIILLCFPFLLSAQNVPKLVKDIYKGQYGGIGASSGTNYKLKAFKDKLFVVADANTVGEALYSYDPALDTLILVKDVCSNNSYCNLHQMNISNDKLFFAGEDRDLGIELWTSDGTSSGTFMLKDLNGTQDGVSQYLSAYAFTSRGVYFSGQTTTHGKELWFSDGTINGTNMLKDIRTGTNGSFPSSLCFNENINLLFFAASDQTAGDELFISDGTPTNTKLIKDIRIGSSGSSIEYITSFNNKVVFTAMTDFNFQTGDDVKHIYVSDGTAAGTYPIFTTEITDIRTDFENLYVVGNELLFTVNNKLYISNGDSLGTVLLTDKLKFDANNYFQSYNGKIFFIAEDSLHGRELFITDKTKAGTKLLKDINPGPGSSNAFYLVPFDGKLYFVANNGSSFQTNELYETDGTEVGTKLTFKINPSGNSHVRDLEVLGKNLYFRASDGVLGQELWKLEALNSSIQPVDKLESNIKIYPNPATGKSFISSDLIIKKYELLDVYGRILISENLYTNNFTINLDPKLVGCYFIKIFYSDKHFEIKKLIVQN